MSDNRCATCDLLVTVCRCSQLDHCGECNGLIVEGFCDCDDVREDEDEDEEADEDDFCSDEEDEDDIDDCLGICTDKYCDICNPYVSDDVEADICDDPDCNICG